ncbi:helix-turn-helix domain-containing protein [Streptomyces sp. p1417]|uniref:Helix-turn-helix domain-containing protein n=1 Tax=Streptomyces typhae TaxID=2681492 RepID=A0A6L6WQF9_9ACTN|nr:helix-turn-helix domain-containing protein [Streptomyces typhae]
MGAEGFADLLKELKERSGLSYGVLAKRLHMSTSTLHRYVNGSAVPVEFAPVERLGRLCKASPEELVELHRRWIVADAGRGRREGGAPAEAGVPPEFGELEGGGPGGGGLAASGGPEPGAVPTRPQALGSAQAGETPLALRDDCPQRQRQQEHEPEPQPGWEVAPEAEPRPGQDDFSESEAGGPLVSDRVPQAAAGKRRRLVVVAAVGAVLALGGTALALQSTSGDKSSGGGRKTSADVGPTAPGEVVEDGKRKQSPSAKASPGHKPEGKKDARGDGDDETGDKKPGGEKGSTGKGGGPAPSGAGSGGGTGGESPVSGAVPLTVSTHPYFWYDPCGNPYLVARDPKRLSPPPNEQDAAGWVHANGAVPAGRQTVKLVVQGTGAETVVLESLDIRVVGSGAPLKRNAYEMGYVGVGCGGNVPKHSFDVNLDASVPRLTPKSGEVSFPYKVSEKDPAAFYVDADVRAHDVSWFLELEWSSGKRHGTVRIDDSGKPFRTSGGDDNPTFGFSLDSKKWIPIERNPDGGVEVVE